VSTNQSIITHVAWTQVASPQYWSCIAISSSGQYQSAVVYTIGGNIWISSDYGSGGLTQDYLFIRTTIKNLTNN
jgi:hypothetical protein